MSALPHEPLQAVSNVIELDPSKRYLFVFNGNFTQNELAQLQHGMEASGLQGISIALREGEALQVIEQAIKNNG